MSENLTKELVFGEECRNELIKGIELLAKAVKSTMGPNGKTCILESPHHTHGLTVTKDGWTVAKSVVLENPVQNMACRILIQAAEKTALLAADGTTTAIVLAEAMILGGTKHITSDINRTEVLRHLEEIAQDIIEELKLKSIPCTDEDILQVAKISSNNDDTIGNLIAHTYQEVGEEGIVRIEKSMTSDTYSEVAQALRIERGYSSPLFVNNWERDERIMENVRILVCDSEITRFSQIDSILKPIIDEKMNLLIIAPCNGDVIATLAANVRAGRINLCIVQPPNFGYRQHELMEDIALNVGATYFSQKQGNDLSLISFEHLGKAGKVIVSKDKTLIFEGKGDKEKINSRVMELQGAYELAPKKHDKDFINERIASLIGGIGVIFVGGNTDMEQKELYDRVEDAVGAVKSAMKEGVIAGAGKPLFEIEPSHDSKSTKEYVIAQQIIYDAIKVPLIQILLNADLKYQEIYKDDKADGWGYNVKTGQYGDLIKMGVIDPLFVTRTALLNAVSVAVTILSTDSAISIQRV